MRWPDGLGIGPSGLGDLWLLFDLPLHHQDMLLGTDNGVTGDGMT